MMSPQNEFIRRLRTKLLTWYRQNARDLPWRRTKEPYRIWLSEVMLQQTQVSTVVPYYRRFLQALPDVRQLATASEDRVLKLWEGLGYYRRARLLQQAARQIVSERRGEFPASGREWREMPGVGPYMAGALASIISGERVPAVDGNVKRILSRLFAYAQEIERPGAAAWLQARAEALVPARRPGDFNQALMDLGAGICRPRLPLCEQCPVRRECAGRATGRPGRFPVRRQKRPVPHIDMAAAVIQKQGKYLVGQRPAGGLLGGLWEFPAVRIEKGETPGRALRRMAGEALGRHLRVGERIGEVEHGYTHFSVTVRIYACGLDEAKAAPGFHTRLRWVTVEQARRLAFSGVNRKIWEKLGQLNI